MTCSRSLPRLLAAALALSSAAALAADSGTSTNLFARWNLDGGWFLSSRSNLATRQGTSDAFFGYADLTIGRRLGRHWSLDAGYRHAWLELPGGWRDEYRPLVNLSWRDRIGDWTLSNRSRIEFRFFEGDTAQDRLRYRNETRVVFPGHWSLGALRPYLEEEFFYEFDGSGLNTNWLTAGLRYPLRDGMTLKAGYRWQAQEFAGDWQHRHVLVTGLVWFF